MEQQKTGIDEQLVAHRAKQKEVDRQRIRSSALIMAEYNLVNDNPKIAELVKVAKEARAKLEETGAELDRVRTTFLQARDVLERELEPHIPEELRIFQTS